MNNHCRIKQLALERAMAIRNDGIIVRLFYLSYYSSSIRAYRQLSYFVAWGELWEDYVLCGPCVRAKYSYDCINPETVQTQDLFHYAKMFPELLIIPCYIWESLEQYIFRYMKPKALVFNSPKMNVILKISLNWKAL